MHIRTAIAAAYSFGRDLDLTACDYGPATGGWFAGPETYYRLLGGLARMCRARKILEIGTHFGGGARALAEGQHTAGIAPNVLTFDVEDRAGAPIIGHDGIHRVLADVREPEGAHRLREWAAGDRIDIVYIDALKDQAFLEETVEALADLDIGWLVFDDIFANRGIRTAWSHFRGRYGDHAMTEDEVALDIRAGGFGQGVIAVDPGVLTALSADSSVLAQLREDALRRWTPALPEDSKITAAAKEGPRERPAELALLRRAVERTTGRGEIVVLGAASGTTTRTLAEALAAKAGPREVSVTVIAGFRTTSAAVSRVREDPITPRRESFLEDFRDRLGDLAPWVNLIAGDVPSLRWPGRPIELLVIGWHRDEAELAHAFSELLPHCIPGGSLMIVQDFGYEAAPFLHAGLGRLIDDVEIVGFVPNALALAPIGAPEPATLAAIADADVAESAAYVDRLDAALTDRLAKVLVERGRTLLRRRLNQDTALPAAAAGATQ